MSPDPQFAEALAAFQRGDLDSARRLAEQQAASEPSPQLDHLLGLICCRRGDLDAGIEHLRRASDAQPENAAFRVMLARALVDKGALVEALAMPEPPRDRTAASLALWHARAEAADAAGDASASRQAWEEIAEARPGDWRAWSNLGNACAALAEWTRAADALGRAASINPAEASIRRNLGSALANCGRFEDAAAELQEAVRLDPGQVEGRMVLARLLADLGRSQEALDELEHASRLAVEATSNARLINVGGAAGSEPAEPIAVDLANPASVRELGMLLERTGQMDALRELLDAARSAQVPTDKLGYLQAASALHDGDADEARRLLQSESPDTDPVRWHRLMAKIADALGDSDDAFAAAETMNRATEGYDEWRSRGADYRSRLRQLAATITPEWAARRPRLPPPGRRPPAFLVGFPRSGTTLLDTFLMGHPETAVLEEVHMLDAAGLVVGKLPELPDCPVATLEQARRAYLAELDRHVEPGFAGLVVDKLPLNMLGLALIDSLFPDAPIIFAQRHPCDAVLSGLMQSFILNEAMAAFLDLADAADLYDVVMEVWTRSREAIPASVHTLVYEDLVADPEAALKPLVGFLGLEWRGELLDHRSTARRRGAILTPSYDQVTKPLDSRPSGRWRRYANHLEPVLPVLLPWADRLGYPR